MIFAQFVLYSWPIIVLILFRNCRPTVALLVSVIAGYLLLPERGGFDLPGLPRINKESIPILSAFFILLLLKPKRIGRAQTFYGRPKPVSEKNIITSPMVRPGWLPQQRLAKLLLFFLFVGIWGTVLVNREVLTYGSKVLPGLRAWDGVSTSLITLTSLLPLFMGRKFLAYPDQQRLFLIILVIAGTAYSVLALYEVRMSPQLNRMVYGFFPHSFAQHIRGSYFRPLVFLNHGLWLAIFFSATIFAAFGLARLSRGADRLIYFCAGTWILLTLILSTSFGAILIAIVLLPVTLFVGIRPQLLIAAVLSSSVLIFPMLRGADIVPVRQISEWVAGYSEDRARSLDFRLENEEILLDKARQKPAFGWGAFSRNHVFDERGRLISTTDGYWIIVLGPGGWVRYVAIFGLLCLPSVLSSLRRTQCQIGLETSFLTIILAGNLIDLIPNATVTPITWLIAGSLWGRLELGLSSEERNDATVFQEYPRNTSHSRGQKQAASKGALKLDDKSSSPQAGFGSNHQRYTRQKARISRKNTDAVLGSKKE